MPVAIRPRTFRLVLDSDGPAASSSIPTAGSSATSVKPDNKPLNQVVYICHVCTSDTRMSGTRRSDLEAFDLTITRETSQGKKKATVNINEGPKADTRPNPKTPKVEEKKVEPPKHVKKAVQQFTSNAGRSGSAVAFTDRKRKEMQALLAAKRAASGTNTLKEKGGLSVIFCAFFVFGFGLIPHPSMSHPTPTSTHSRNASTTSSMATTPSLEEFSLLKAQSAILKKAVLEEQTTSKALAAQLKTKEQKLREALQQLDLQVYHNESLTKRIDSMREEMKNKGGKSRKSISSDPHTAVLSEELENKILDNERLHEKLSDSLADVANMTEQVKELSTRNKQLMESHSRLEAENTHLHATLDANRYTFKAQLAESKARETALKDSLQDLTQSLRRISARITLEGVGVEAFKANNALVGNVLNWLKALREYHMAFCDVVGKKTPPNAINPHLSNSTTALPSPPEFRKLIVTISGWLTEQSNILTSPVAKIPGNGSWNEIIAEDVMRVSLSLEDLGLWYTKLHESEDGSFEETMCNARLNMFANEFVAARQDLVRHWSLKLKSAALSISTEKLIETLGGNFGDSSLSDDFLTPSYQQALIKMATINSRVASLTALQNNVARYWAGKNNTIPDTAYSNGEVPPSVKRVPVKVIEMLESSTQAQPDQITTSTQSQLDQSETSTQTAGTETKSISITTDSITTTDVSAQTLEDASVNGDLLAPPVFVHKSEADVKESSCQTDEDEEKFYDTRMDGSAEMAVVAQKTVETATVEIQTTPEPTATVEIQTISELLPNSDDSIPTSSTTVPTVQKSSVTAESEETSLQSSFIEIRTRIPSQNTTKETNGNSADYDDVVVVRKEIRGTIWDQYQVSQLMERLQVAEAKAARLERMAAQRT
ncbi:hypothetical protein HDU97_000222 [Phlyctochytrium planicorne]|nr:hypothetical protein HDU97_000222 [Phlyctochytrium planicorne]